MQAPIQNVPIDYYHSQQQNYFHSIPAYPSYYPQPIHHQPSYSSSISSQQQGGQSRQQPSTTSSPSSTTTTSSPSPLAGFCEICTPNVNSLVRQGIPIDQVVNNTACDKCKNAYWSHQANMSRPQPNVSSTVVPQNQLQRDVHQQQQPPQQMLQSQQQRQVLNQSISSRPQVVAPTVPAQSENPQVSSTIPSDSMVSDMPICFSSEPLPTISYDNGPKDQAKTSLLRDVFFSSGMSDDVDLMDVLHFDSDTSSDTEVLTPGHCSPPLSPLSPTSPKEFCAGDEELYSFFYNEQSDESDEKKVDAMAIDQAFTKVTRSIKTCNTYSDLKKRITNNLVSDNNVNSNISSSRLSDAFPFTQSQALAVSPLAVIDPMLLLSNRTVIDENSNKNNDQVVSTDNASVIDPMMSLRIRPNFIDIDNSANLSSPPLRTPELVSDSSRKRKASYISSSDEGSDNEVSAQDESNPQKKICPDNLMHSGLESMNVDHEDGYVRPCDTIIEQEEYMASSDSVSTDSEQDDDEEYRPSPTSTKKVTPIIKKSKTSKSKSSLKTKSRKSKSANHLRQKAKNASLKRGGGKAPAKTVVSKKSTKLSVPSSPSAESPAPSEASSNVEQEHQEEEPVEELELCDPRPTQSPTIFESLTQAGVDWCRYCGTTEGVNWRPGPWGKRTLCNKHGCDYKGYGFACKLPRLDLTSFVDEAVEKRDRPVLQLFCTGCHKQESYVGNVLVRCEGCPRAFHQKCHPTGIDDETVNNNEHWYCERSCHDNLRRKRIVVELPRKRLPLMSTPKAQASTSSESSPMANVGTTSRPRTSRNSTRT